MATLKKVLFILLFLTSLPLLANAAALGQTLFGRILLDVERKGEAWYVNPVNHQRYYLGRPDDAFKIMRELGLGINEIDFQKIAQAGMPVTGDLITAKRLSGRIVIRVEQYGEAWYINPVDLKKYYLGRPADAFKIMRELSLGISRGNLALIHKPGLNESINSFSQYEHKKVKTKNNEFTIDLVTIDLTDPNLKIITSTADNIDCQTGCQARSLADYVLANNGFAAINGTYFETVGDKKNYYFFPVYNSTEKLLINADQMKYWTTGPILAFDKNNKFYYFKDSREFDSVIVFEAKYNIKIQAALGNKPRLIENKMNLLIDWEIDPKQRDGKYQRNAIAYKENKIYLVVAQNATIPDLADILQVLDVDHAINLDGGYSSALWYNDEYMVGPGRDIPNAIIFAEKQ